MNIPETVWQALKKGSFPSATGEEEKRLKIAFLQGLHSGRMVTLSGVMNLDGKDLQTFFVDLREQTTAALTQLGEKPGDITLGVTKS